jgi:response regulator RpfG family c-di-GMP phosphodiesterase
VSQVVALADFYDIARTGKANAPPQSLSTIMGRVRKESGTRFSPRLVLNFPRALRIFEQMETE